MVQSDPVEGNELFVTLVFVLVTKPKAQLFLNWTKQSLPILNRYPFVRVFCFIPVIAKTRYPLKMSQGIQMIDKRRCKFELNDLQFHGSATKYVLSKPI